MGTEITEFKGGEYYHMTLDNNRLILKAKGSGENVVCYSLSIVDRDIKKYSDDDTWCSREDTHKGLRKATSDEIVRLNKCIDEGEYVPEDDTPEITEFIYNEYYHMKLSGGGYVIFKSKSEKTSKHVFGISTSSTGDYRRDGGWNIKYCHEGLRKATPDESTWLDVCISNDKFIPNAMVIKETIVEDKCKFKVGDKVKRIRDTHQGMDVGNVSTITSIEDGYTTGKFTLKLSDFPYGHSSEMFELYTSESKYLNASQLVVGETYRHDIKDGHSFIFQFKEIIEASDYVIGFCCYCIGDSFNDDMYSIGIGSSKFSPATDSEKARLIGTKGYVNSKINKVKANNINFKVGDKVKITCNQSCHKFNVGEIVTITNVSSSGYSAKGEKGNNWSFTDCEAEAYQYRSGPPSTFDSPWSIVAGPERGTVDEFPASTTLKLGGKKNKVKFIPYMEEEEDTKEIELTFKSL